MKIGFFTEGNYQGQIPRNHPNMRTDVAWVHALGAIHQPIHRLQELPNNHFDYGFFIIPKNKEYLFDYPLIEQLRRICGKIGTIQESTYWYWQGGTVRAQLWYHDVLQSVDHIYCHNNMDLKYYRGITDTECKLIPTLMITDHIKEFSGERTGVMVGGNWVTAYRGIDSYVIGKILSEYIYSPTTGRMKADEPELTDIIHLPWVNWLDWMHELSKRKYAVQLGTAAAGTFQLNCAYLGIPCIGYNNLNTQQICFPLLSVDDGDILEARHIAKHLYTNTQFYDHCSALAKKNYKEYYDEQVFLTKFNNLL